MQVRSLGREDPLEEHGNHVSVLSWRTPWTGPSGRLWSIGSQRVRQNQSDLARMRVRTHTHILYYIIFSMFYYNILNISSVQFSSVTQSCPILCDSMNRSTPGLPVHHQLLEFTQTHVHRVGDAIQPSHPLLSPSPPAPNPSQHQSLFQ